MSNDGNGQEASSDNTANMHCRDCALQHYSDLLTRQRLRMMENDRARVINNFENLRAEHEKLQQQLDQARDQLTRLHLALMKKAGDMQTEYQARVSTQQLWLREREMCERHEIRLQQSSGTLRQLAAIFHISMIDHAGLTENQKTELKKMDYAQVLHERDSLRAHCIELQNKLPRPRSVQQPRVAR
ncbi:MAG: hypothetical protein Q9207_003696 [Kuettlingeria erythrocarpa]